MSEHLQIGLINSFSLHWTDSLSPTALGQQSRVWTLGCAWLTTAHVKRSGAYTVHRCYLCTQVYCTHSFGVITGCHLAYTEAIKLSTWWVHCVHNSTAGIHRCHIAVHAVLAKSNQSKRKSMLPTVEYQGHTYVHVYTFTWTRPGSTCHCTHLHGPSHLVWRCRPLQGTSCSQNNTYICTCKSMTVSGWARVVTMIRWWPGRQPEEQASCVVDL